jgi:hypothetical protein
MYEELAKDNMFMARFLHFLDMVFNNFCDDLAEYHTKRSPIESARRCLRGRMKDDIDRVMRDIHHGIIPNLPLPTILSGNVEDTPKPKDTPSGVKQQPSADAEKKAPAWWSRNPRSSQTGLYPKENP